MTDPMLRFEQEGLVISAWRAQGKGTVVWAGISDSRNPTTFLNPILREVTDRMKGADVTLDFTKLEYMNSATVSPLLNFVKTLDEKGSRVLVVFSEIDWQRTHLQCMRAIARTLRNVSVESRPA